MIMATKRAENGIKDTIVPAPGAHKTRPVIADISHAKPAAPKKAKPTKQEAAAAAVAKMRQATIDLAPAPAPSELVMMPLSLIEARAQVRTEFSDESLAELAADIAARGVLQPVLLRPTPGQCNYLVITGERRVRAARLAQLDTIPAIIGDVDDDTAASMQIAENIQREDLCLADEAAAVRTLYELAGNSVTAVAARLHKSKSWVSKRLAASCPDLNHMAKNLLVDGFTEDLEIILTIDKMQAIDWNECQLLCNKIRAGEAGRQTVREAYEALKEKNEREKAEREARNSPEATAKHEKEAAAQKEFFDKQAEERKAKERLDPMRLRWKYDEDLEVDQLDVLGKHLEQLHTSGVGVAVHDMIRGIVRMNNNGYAAIEIAAFVAGSYGTGFDLGVLIRLTKEGEAVEGEDEE